MIGIIGAMNVEVDTLVKSLKDEQEFVISEIKYTKGILSGRECVIAKSSPGKVNAAICTQTMILKFSPDYIINIGVAGAILNSLHVGDVALAENVVQHDVDTSPLGDPKGMVSGINLIEIPCSKYLIEKVSQILEEQDITFFKGTIITGDQFIANKEDLYKLGNDFKGIACEMEGGSIGQVCYINGVEFIVLRSISDSADENSAYSYEKFVEISAQKSCELIKRVIQKI